MNVTLLKHEDKKCCSCGNTARYDVTGGTDHFFYLCHYCLIELETKIHHAINSQN